MHVPFCSSRCSYCDFHTSACASQRLTDAAEVWFKSIQNHLAALESRFGQKGFFTVYMGGGTPSHLPGPVLSDALDMIGLAARRNGAEPVEWTLEANPEDLDLDLLKILGASGVNRLSVGVQSLEDKARKIARRRGDARSTLKRLELISSAWPGAWSTDLMYGLPGQTSDGLAADVQTIVDAGAGHISLYELTLEDDSPLCKAVRAGELRLPDQDERADTYEAAADTLIAAGFRRYEISNWARAGYNCIHNELYWRMGDWLALGPAAVGNLATDGGALLRMENSASDEKYFSDPVASTGETLVSGREAMFERLMTAMRTANGFDPADFENRHKINPASLFGDLPALFPELVRREQGNWSPTYRGMDMLNTVLVAALTNADDYYAKSQSEYLR